MLFNSRPGRLVLLFVLSLFAASSAITASLQSRFLYMPVLQYTGSADSKLTLVNPALEPAAVTLTARSYSGALLRGPGIINPVVMTVPASSSSALQARELFGSGVSSGWVEVQTASSAVSGGFFLSDSKQTLVDGSELSTSPASRLIFPKVTSNVSSANRLVFVNTSSNAISPVTISFFEDSGRLVTQRNIALAAFAGFSGSITDLAPNLRSFDGYAVVETNSAQRALIGLETYRSGNDQALLAAMPEARRLGTGYVPQFGNQTGSISTLVLVNYGSGLQTVKLTAAVTDVRYSNGSATPLTARWTLAANERVETRLDRLFGFSAQTAIGHVAFDTDRTQSAGIYAYLESKTPSGVLAAVEAHAGASHISFSDFSKGGIWSTGLALINAGSQTSFVTIDVLHPLGYTTGTATLTLAPNTRFLGLLSDLLPGMDDQIGGRVHVTASSPILAAQTLGSVSTGAVSVVPAQTSALAAQASGQMVSAAAGALVTSADASASLSIPPGALSNDSPVRITRLNVADLPAPPGGEHLIGVVEGTPDGTHFRSPVRLRFALTEALQPDLTINLLIFNPVTKQYQPSGFTAIVERSGRTASAGVTHFTQFAAATSVSSVQVSNLSPTSGLVGTVVTISGSGFLLTPSLNTVLFSAGYGKFVPAPALTSTSTSLTTKVPSGTVSGKVYVQVGSVQSNDVVRFTVITPTDQPPVVVTGADQAISLPSGASLSGTITDDGYPNGTLTASWSVVSGPGTVTFGTPTASTTGPSGQSLTLTSNTAASFSLRGTYTLRLTASDGQLSASGDTIITVDASSVNQPPVVSAGADQTITLPAGANLTGTATDDGLPNGTLTAAWSVVSGPGTVAFGNANAFTTTATFSAAGSYTLQLTASDGELSSSSTTTVTVNPQAVAPTVSAGPNQTINLPSSANLSGTVTDPCLPNCTVTVNWSMASGPGTVTFGNAAALSTTATFSTAGTYVLQLTANDGTLSSSSTTAVTVNSCGVAVTGTVTLTANVTSSVGIAGVQFTLDGVNLGPNLTTAPYSLSWNTATVPNACHLITAVATDTLGNEGSATISAGASNP